MPTRLQIGKKVAVSSWKRRREIICRVAYWENEILEGRQLGVHLINPNLQLLRTIRREGSALELEF
jgi:hypothetical protein